MAPTASFSALSVGILVALEPLKYVVAFGIAGLAGQTRGVVRAGTAATDEHDERLGINLLLELCQEMAIRLIGRIVQPSDFLGTGNATTQSHSARVRTSTIWLRAPTARFHGPPSASVRQHREA